MTDYQTGLTSATALGHERSDEFGQQIKRAGVRPASQRQRVLRACKHILMRFCRPTTAGTVAGMARKRGCAAPPPRIVFQKAVQEQGKKRLESGGHNWNPCRRRLRLLKVLNWPATPVVYLLQFMLMRLIFFPGLRCLNVGFMPSKGNLLRTQAGLVYFQRSTGANRNSACVTV